LIDTKFRERILPPFAVTFPDTLISLNQFASTVKFIFQLHGFLHVQQNARAKSFLYGVVTEQWQSMQRSLDLAAFLLAFGPAKGAAATESGVYATLSCPQPSRLSPEGLRSEAGPPSPDL
jgi:hypothetical protein